MVATFAYVKLARVFFSRICGEYVSPTGAALWPLWLIVCAILLNCCRLVHMIDNRETLTLCDVSYSCYLFERARRLGEGSCWFCDNVFWRRNVNASSFVGCSGSAVVCY